MESDNDNDLLRALAEGKGVDLELWPGLLSRLVTRIEKTIIPEFPNPSKRLMLDSGVRSPCQDLSNSVNDQIPLEENATENSYISSLPSILRNLISSINETLFRYFSKAPPHTIQRLAELVLCPHQNYRTLTSYLHALDRVVHVTSPATVFPLPLIVSDSSSTAFLPNGTTTDGIDTHSIPRTYSVANNLLIQTIGSDEGLGGALLTPISWLRKSRSSSPIESEVVTQRSTEIIEGPNGPGGVETVSVSINGICKNK